MDRTHDVTVVLFEGFELLDVFGPVQLLSMLPEEYSVTFVAPQAGPVRSSQGAQVIAEQSLAEAPTPDIVLIPGGIGTRALVADADFLSTFREWARGAQVVTSVCTGSGVLAAAGLLEGYRATSNKLAFRWAVTNGTDVTWVPQARWVEDRDRWTSSGVAAGMDMTAALIAKLSGPQAAADAAATIELEIHEDSTWDPFAARHGLV